MSSNYTATLTDGTTLGAVHPFEINGGSIASTPRQIQETNVTDFKLIDDLTYRFLPGFQFSVINSAGGLNDGLYTVDVVGSTYDGTHTIINVTTAIPSTALPFGAIEYTVPSSEILTSLSLVGRGNLNFGELFINNSVHLLENFASTTQPISPLDGQSWYNKTDSTLYVYNGTTFVPIYGGTDWGSLGGTLTDQTDLNVALSLKSDNTHNHDSDYVNVAGDTMNGTLVISTPAAASAIELHDIMGVNPSKISFFDSISIERGIIMQSGDVLSIVNIVGTAPDINIMSSTDVNISGSTVVINDVIFPDRASQLTFPATNGTTGQVLTSTGAGSVAWNTPTPPTPPQFESFTSTAAQVVFNTTIQTATNVSGGVASLLVYVNGALQLEGPVDSYQVTSTNQITFNGGLLLADRVVIYSFV